MPEWPLVDQRTVRLVLGLVLVAAPDERQTAGLVIGRNDHQGLPIPQGEIDRRLHRLIEEQSLPDRAAASLSWQAQSIWLPSTIRKKPALPWAAGSGLTCPSS